MKKPHKRILAFATHVVNPVTRKFAGSPHSPFVIIRHVGRRSGKPYETPLVVRRVTGGFVGALTYGPGVDWYRNIVAAGGGTLLWQGREYAIGMPELLPAKAGLAAFPLPVRSILRLLHIQDFFQVKSQRRSS